jgi:hypothetical protein
MLGAGAAGGAAVAMPSALENILSDGSWAAMVSSSSLVKEMGLVMGLGLVMVREMGLGMERVMVRVSQRVR